MKTIIYVVRHGITAMNASGKIQGRSDIPLSEEGFSQARKAHGYFKDKDIARVYPSPLVRAVQTAETIVKGKNIELIVEPRVVERDFGNFEGTPMPKVFMEDIFDEDTPGYTGERRAATAQRMYDALCDLGEKNLGKEIIVVSHGNAIGCLLRKLNSDLYYQKKKDGTFLIKNCSTAEFEYENGKLSLISWPHGEYL